MLRLQRHRLLDISQRLRNRLLWQPVHQVQVEIRQPRRVQLSDRAPGVRRAVDAAQPLQLLGIEALCPQRYAVDTCSAIVGEPTSFDRARVGLQRDLEIGRDVTALAHASQQPRQRLWCEQARCPASQEDTLQRTALHRARLQ